MRLSGASLLGVIFAVCFFLLAAGPASAACDANKVIFEDDFEFLDISWGPTRDELYAEDGALIIEGYKGQVNWETLNKTADVCVDMTVLDSPAADRSMMGLVFWWQDWNNYYAVWVWPSGWIQARRMVNGNETFLFAEESPALKKGLGETNHIQLRLKPRDATLYVNGTEIKRFKGKPPPNGAPIGFYGISPDEGPAKFAYDNLIVSELGE